ncbi:hypothetical protein EES42_41425 [Streptomyces sp. ADI95-17]|nr:hypothetical protein EES42_41425 [Streptomyces sp. ADI95-17]
MNRARSAGSWQSVKTSSNWSTITNVSWPPLPAPVLLGVRREARVRAGCGPGVRIRIAAGRSPASRAC